MKYQRLFLLCCIFIATFLPQASHACTTFCLDTHDELVVGQNFDWINGDALIIFNKRNVTKTAFLPPSWAGGEPVSWTSKYGSVTVNFLGREFPFEGMNEAGLVVSAMDLGLTEYPAPDARPAITHLQWIQYQLDTAATVADVIASDLKLRINKADTTRACTFLFVTAKGIVPLLSSSTEYWWCTKQHRQRCLLKCLQTIHIQQISNIGKMKCYRCRICILRHNVFVRQQRCWKTMIRKHPDLQLITHLIFCRIYRVRGHPMEYRIRYAASPHQFSYA